MCASAQEPASDRVPAHARTRVGDVKMCAGSHLSRTVTLTMGQASAVREDGSTELREHEWSTSSTRSCAPAKAVKCAGSSPSPREVGEAEDVFTDLTDDELREETDRFKERLEDGETLDDVMVEAFAAVREAARRTLGQRPYDVQIMGGAALHRGRIAEMKTGEGKTLVATLPAYLNALAGKGVHVITVNDYLAGYQSDLMGRVFRVLGLTTGVHQVRHDPGGASRAVRRGHHLRHEQRVRLRLPARQHGAGRPMRWCSAGTTS